MIVAEQFPFVNCRYDGNTVFGYRLYREVNGTEPQTKAKGKTCLTLPTVCSHWETLAVDFKEFRGVVVSS